MSPEQCHGAELDVRSDIYSLGCVMYTALTGHKLFESEGMLQTMQKQQLLEIQQKMLAGKTMTRKSNNSAPEKNRLSAVDTSRLPPASDKTLAQFGQDAISNCIGAA